MEEVILTTTISEGDIRKGIKELDFLTSFDSLGFLYAQLLNI